MIAEQYPGLLNRPDEEKLQLAAELWQDVMGERTEADDPAMEILMEARWREYQNHPGRVRSWEELKLQLLASAHES